MPKSSRLKEKLTKRHIWHAKKWEESKLKIQEQKIEIP